MDFSSGKPLTSHYWVGELVCTNLVPERLRSPSTTTDAAQWTILISFPFEKIALTTTERADGNQRFEMMDGVIRRVEYEVDPTVSKWKEAC
jgi:hypothetical protein